MNVTGEILKALIETVPEVYIPFVVKEENGKKELYLQLKKILYEYLQISMLFWRRLSDILTNKIGITINPYDRWLVNKVINSSQCTIVWWVDNLKVRHQSREVVKDLIAKIGEVIGDLVIEHGPKVTYLGMRMDLS